MSQTALSGPELAAAMKVGTRVVRGADGIYPDQDGNPPGQGTVAEVKQNGTYNIRVKWDTGYIGSYRMGPKGKYDLKLADPVPEQQQQQKRAIKTLNSAHKRVKYSEDDSNNSSESSQNSSVDISEGVEEDLKSQMVKLLSSVKLHKDAWPFLYPVNEDDAPGYYEIIKDPVDLSNIEHRLHKGKYETVGDLDENFSKMVSNCELYNGENHAYSKMAQTLHILFRKEVAALLEMVETIPPNPDSEESSDGHGQYHSSSNSNTSSSPSHETPEVESNENKKVKSKKKQRKHGNQEALDLLAQAADAAVKQDGNLPGQGTVTEVKQNGAYNIKVKWNTGYIGSYRMGPKGKYDLKHADPVPEQQQQQTTEKLDSATERVINDLGNILDSKEYSDITVKVKDKEFHLHKCILTGRSAYFDSMFKSEMKEKKTNVVSIDDCEPDIFDSFIYFVYTGKVKELSDDNVCALYVIADKYHEDQLKAKCVNFMKDNISIDNICDFIALALRHDEKELLKDAIEFFCKKTNEIIHSVKWQTFMREYPTQANELYIKAYNAK